MNNEEKFKNSVRDLLDEQYYPYDPDNWEQASNYLDAEDKRKRRGLFFLLAGLGLSIALTVYLLLPSGSEGTQKDLTENQEEKTEAVREEAPGNTYKTQEAPAASPEMHRPMAGKMPQSDPASPEPTAETPAVVSPGSLPGKQPEQTNVSAEIKAKLVTPRRIKSFTVVNSGNVSGNADKEIIRPVKENTKTYDHSGKANDQPGDDGRPSEDNARASSPESPAADQEQKEEQLGSPGFTGSGTPDAKAAGADTVLSTKPNDTEKITLSAQSADTIRPAGQPTVQSLPPGNYCYVEAGAFVNLGWTYQGVREGTGFNPYLGVSYLMRLTDKAGFSIGAYYTTLAGLKLDTKVIRSSKIVFGEESDVVAITPVRLNYIAVPLRLQYTIDEKQMLTAGYTAGYLLDVQSRVETYTEKLSTQENKMSYMTGGYVEGFRTFNSQLSLGYRRQIYKGLWGNAEIFYGLTDVRDNVFFGIDRRESATGLKISLTYDLLKK